MPATTFYVPFVGGTILGSAHNRPWLANTLDTAIAVGSRPGPTPVFRDRQLAERYVAWARDHFEHMKDWDVRELTGRAYTYPDRPTTYVSLDTPWPTAPGGTLEDVTCGPVTAARPGPANRIGRCIDSDTQATVPAAAGDHVVCGNCGATVMTYARHGDSNRIPFLAEHSMPENHDHERAGGSPARAGGGEVTGLDSAKRYAASMATAFTVCDAGVAEFTTSLQGLGVSGEAIVAADQAAEAQQTAAAAWHRAHAALVDQDQVAQAYEATPGAGAREFVAGE